MKRKETKERKKKIKYFKKTFSKHVCYRLNNSVMEDLIAIHRTPKAINDKIIIGDFYIYETLKNDPEDIQKSNKTIIN